jgi:hypothetical protein
MKKVFLLTGHENFGKSKTLVELTSGVKNSQHICIDGNCFTLKRTSNDDIGEKLLKFIEEKTKADNCLLIMAFCPNFNDSKRCSKEIIKTLVNNGCSLYFFVLMQRYNGKERVSEKEIESLKEFGEVFLSESNNAEKRAMEFKNYIKEKI